LWTCPEARASPAAVLCAALRQSGLERVQIVSARQQELADISLPWLSPFSLLRNRPCLQRLNALRVFVLSIITAALGGHVPDSSDAKMPVSRRMRGAGGRKPRPRRMCRLSQGACCAACVCAQAFQRLALCLRVSHSWPFSTLTTVLSPCVPLLFASWSACAPQLDAKDEEIQRLQEELKAAQEYSRVCEDESVELRRQLFDMTKQFKKLNKELERLSAARASQAQPAAALPASVAPTDPASRKTASCRTICLASSETHVNTSDGGSDSCTSSGGDHSMDEGSALRRSARLRPSSAAHAVDASAAAVSKRKASARASTVAAEGEGRLAPGSKKKRIEPDNSRSLEAVNASVEQVVEVVVPAAVAREDRVVGQAGQVEGRGGENPGQPTEEEQAPSSPLVTAGEQMKLLDVLIEANLQLQEGWLPRMRALKQLKTLLTSPGHLKCEEQAFVDKMLPALVVQVSDARSQIVREACDTITALLPTLNKYYADVARVLLPQMWKLTYVSASLSSLLFPPSSFPAFLPRRRALLHVARFCFARLISSRT
jgi:hypothetical protein